MKFKFDGKEKPTSREDVTKYLEQLPKGEFMSREAIARHFGIDAKASWLGHYTDNLRSIKVGKTVYFASKLTVKAYNEEQI